VALPFGGGPLVEREPAVGARGAAEATAEGAREDLVAQEPRGQGDREHALGRPHGERRGRSLQAQP
jgi:hypothetical protein